MAINKRWLMLTNDRKLQISSAGSRKATNWPAQTLWWSELVERLKTPVRSTESLGEYLGYPKSKQDELKDVGGFVAGTLEGNRRKANNTIGRDVVTLDIATGNIEAVWGEHLEAITAFPVTNNVPQGE